MAKILVIDDHPSNRDLLVALLSREGHQILEADSGEQGLALALGERPELVITDIVMPTMDGYEFVGQLRAALGERAPAVIFYSASYHERETRALAQACGVRFVLTKPCKLEMILQTVEAALHSGGVARAKLGKETVGLASRVLAEKQLSETTQLQATTERMRALADIALILMAERDPARLLEKCCSAARKIVGSRYANAGLLGEDGKTVRHFAVSGMDREQGARCGPALICGGPLHLVLAERRLVSLRAPISNPVALGFYLEHPPIHSYLAVRIQTSAGICGWLAFANKLGRDEFDEEEERIALSLASQLAVTYENASLYERLSQYTAQLQREIAGRERAEAQLLQVQKMEAVGQLAGSVAHDFNNLLTIVSGYSELLLDNTNSEDPARASLEEIKKAGQRAAALTHQLLAFSRQQVLAPKVLDLNVAVADMDKMLRRVIGEDIDLVTAHGAELGRVKADPGQIEQVIMNLAVNARDAMPQGGKLTLETANLYLGESYAQGHVPITPGAYVMLAVTDTGCGMDKETQGRIFEPFFTTKERGGGTGLGLATVYGIVQQSGGVIWVYSEVGQGTTFKIYLPRVEEVGTTPEPTRARPAPPRGSETILVVEDEEPLRRLVRTVLRANGYTVLEASRGEEALRICEHQLGIIHLMLTDVVMPQMNGRELATRVASMRPETKVLFMSGYTDNAIVHQGVLDAGAAFMQKPFTPDALARKVREVLAA
jgi:signal transduction histidine kinase/DNA-binding response OmpR family regulator